MQPLSSTRYWSIPEIGLDETSVTLLTVGVCRPLAGLEEKNRKRLLPVPVCQRHPPLTTKRPQSVDACLT